MKIIITGGRGQLGRELAEVLLEAGGHEVMSPGRQELDVTRMEEVIRAFKAFAPEVVIHAAAATNVDQCELDHDRAYLVNALGTRNVAAAAAVVGAKLIFISTDYVFNGRAGRPYTEFDAPDPINIYGKSKLAGERYAAELCPRYFIVRTSWLYGRHGKNFVKTMLDLAGKRDEIAVVDDQVGSPTYVGDLARFIAGLIETELYGIYHASNGGECSWFDFAREIFRLAGLDHVRVRPISSEELNRPAPRPAYSVLDNYCIRLQGLPDLRCWQEALRDFLKGEVLS